MQCSTEQVKVAGRIGQLSGTRDDAGHGDELLALLRNACRFDAAGIVRWDETASRHVSLTSIGYDEGLSTYFADTFPSTVASERIRSGRFPLRIDDAPHDFRDSDAFTGEIAPRGFDDGMSAALYLDSGDYVGMVHMSSESARRFDDDIRDFVAAVAPLIASVVNIVEPSSDGAVYAPVRWIGIDDPPASVALAAKRFQLGQSRSLRALWFEDGDWQHIEFVRSTSGSGQVAATVSQGPVPYRLTRREVEIATALISGLPNKIIGSCLHISQRTVGKHVERILYKLACSSRSTAASICLREGIIDLGFMGRDSIPSHRAFSPLA
jgi:DNA-binding CsgD family transcriptional regulator